MNIVIITTIILAKRYSLFRLNNKQNPAVWRGFVCCDRQSDLCHSSVFILISIIVVVIIVVVMIIVIIVIVIIVIVIIIMIIVGVLSG